MWATLNQCLVYIPSARPGHSAPFFFNLHVALQNCKTTKSIVSRDTPRVGNIDHGSIFMPSMFVVGNNGAKWEKKMGLKLRN